MIVELLPPHTRRAFEAMHELRAALASPDEFVERVDDRQRPAGYRLVGSVIDDAGAALAVAGFRVAENLAWGRHLYVDDLSTLPAARQQGHAAALLAWLHDEARRLGCHQVHLDPASGRTGCRRTGSTSDRATGSAPTTSLATPERPA